MTVPNDRLYELLPVVYRLRDAERGQPLRALLAVIAEQVGVVEDDIAQLYENWFIETADDWAVPYLADLIGYRPVSEAGQPGADLSPRGIRRNAILVPRREVANTIRNRRRKGTLALLELLAHDVAGWPARAVEFYRLLAVAPRVETLPAEPAGRFLPSRTVDLRRGDLLERLGTPFDEAAHTVDVRRPDSTRTPGRHGVPSVGLFVWRLRPYSITMAPAHTDDRRPRQFRFSILGNDTPLLTRPLREDDPSAIAGELNVPAPIRRRALAARLADYYGGGKSLSIWRDGPDDPVPLEQIVVADLSGWAYAPRGQQVAVDPVLGRIAFGPDQQIGDVRVSYHYGFSDDLGGGEYVRPVRTPDRPGRWTYRVDPSADAPLEAALRAWREADPDDGVVELPDSGEYAGRIRIELRPNQRLEVRAANGARPLVRIVDLRSNRLDALHVEPRAPAGPAGGRPAGGGPRAAGARPAPAPRQPGEPAGRIVLDGLLIAGRGVVVRGPLDHLEIRHCTLVPGWTLGADCEPEHGPEPSLRLEHSGAHVVVERSIVGSIEVAENEVTTDPIRIEITDSAIDATAPDVEALSTGDGRMAHARLTLVRSTVFGRIFVHAVDLAENSILGLLKVARRGIGCVRFCYLEPGSRTPRRYGCQPDGVEAALAERRDRGELPEADYAPALARERARVRPRFASVRYGTPTYCQLGPACADEIRRGADDASEMGVFHDLYQPQRHANLDVRLDEYTPAGTDVGIIYAS